MKFAVIALVFGLTDALRITQKVAKGPKGPKEQKEDPKSPQDFADFIFEHCPHENDFVITAEEMFKCHEEHHDEDLTQKQKDRFQKAFEDHDEDEDKQLTKKELASLIESCMKRGKGPKLSQIMQDDADSESEGDSNGEDSLSEGGEESNNDSDGETQDLAQVMAQLEESKGKDSDDQEKYLKKFFDHLDANENGSIDEKEFSDSLRTFLANHGLELDDKYIEYIFDHANHDGSDDGIDFKEFKEAMMHINRRFKQYQKEFDYLSQKDGAITFEDLMDFAKKHGVELDEEEMKVAKEFFAMIDQDSNGEINSGEYIISRIMVDIENDIARNSHKPQTEAAKLFQRKMAQISKQ